MTAALRFACTLCGACCNRSPEVGLSEAAGLADIFVFRLMFRCYWLPRAAGPGEDKVAFYERKRLLGAFAARKAPARGRGIDGTRYLTISALALDHGDGACAALADGRCTIHPRRPLACRSVPFHYSRPAALAARDLAAFVAMPGHRCDTSEEAAIVIEGGAIVDPGARQARADAAALADRDRGWGEAIVRRLGATPDLPSLQEIEANAAFGATIAPMRVAWRIAAEAGLIGADECAALAEAQLGAIDRALARPGADAALSEIRADYRRHPG